MASKNNITRIYICHNISEAKPFEHSPKPWHLNLIIPTNIYPSKQSHVLHGHSIMNNEENFAVNIERIFDAQIEKVWDAWADGEKMREWSCPNGFNIIEHSGKFEVGETYNVTMKSDFYEGTIAGKFLKIEKPNKIVQTHFWDNKDGTFTVETFVTLVF